MKHQHHQLRRHLIDVGFTCQMFASIDNLDMTTTGALSISRLTWLILSGSGKTKQCFDGSLLDSNLRVTRQFSFRAKIHTF